MVIVDRGQKLGRRERKKRAVRTRLYDAAIALFRSRGFQGTTVEDITRRADTAKGTFFNYFPTKEHVLAAYHDRMTGAIVDRLERIEVVDAERAIQESMGACADWVEGDPAMGRIVVKEIFGSPVLSSADLRNAERFGAWFRARIEEGIRRGKLRREVDVDVMVSMLAAVLSSTMNAWVVTPGRFDLRNALERKTRFVFDAARTEGRQGDDG